MRFFDLIPAQFRIAIVVLLLVALAAGSAALAWQVQAWRYDGKLARQASLQADDLNNLTQAALRQQQAEQDKRLATEQQLAVSDQQHIRELSDAHRNQAALRDRLATADVRLSVLLDATDSTSGCNVPAASGTVDVVHGALRAQLDPAHAQRIIGITDTGDQGLIALRACQAYLRAIRR
ncbi:lysis system i-spanin subunit Rz [Pseudomonas extremorientalis]|uniref:Bacteriophage Rz lysis protein n=1 Tax=Pseudomonas extremorientalis TaxID=169669 RepID=A0A1H0KSX2_9PSED|nr:lysis system i-spanin subunit Rz [Pseudomonas extremorientalis]KAB0517567.1 lysis protein [Pseudomonas extremorientalis]OIN05008.1 lysozyme [Pseudomonas extremorientalis]SDO58882.1 Bacteriophage Rz lysis protein [Pseudomonas extremorientalis]